jgi:hypothetical protein
VVMFQHWALERKYGAGTYVKYDEQYMGRAD